MTTSAKTPAASNVKPLPKIIVVKKELNEAGWNRSLPVPLRGLEKVIIVDNQKGVAGGYVRVKHGPADNRVESIFSKWHFLTLAGKEFGQ